MSELAEPAAGPPASGLISRSHLGIDPFELRLPASLAEAAAAVANGSWAHAGGIDVAQRLRAGEVADELVPLCAPRRSAGAGLERLTEISLGERSLFIGAGVSHARIESDPLVQAHRPDVAAAWRTIGNVRIRAAGTLGGNLAAFHPGYDAAPILAAAGAELIVAEPDGTEVRCAVADVPRHRLIVGCEIPLSGRVVYDRSLKPVVSVAVGEQAVAIGCAYAATCVIPHGAANPEDVTAAVAALGDPIEDAFATAAYRRRMIDVLVDRCLRMHADPSTSRDDDGIGSPASPSDLASDTAPSDASSRDSAASTAHVEMHPSGEPFTAAAAPVVTPPSDGAVHVGMRLNGESFAAAAPPSEMLVDTIRTRAGLGATRVGCDQAVCGACTVLVDGVPTASCSTFAWQADGRSVLTIEAAGASVGANAHDDVASILPIVQGTFAESSAFQCGYCTPGLILVAAALLARHPDPDRATICDWLDSNVCRCTGYLMVIEAVEAAAAALGEHASTDVSAGSAA
ncbi:2Fe-2S iron-sulfur cluster-binding protein [Candidatus Poriferisodalis sp.]|uniref:2Fe-2S iron-sulfur cluster-binding protein n=1 Tax=Candidatus Poriferisodalis sp. TaxID=3101277 RepID=UPI003B0119BE